MEDKQLSSLRKHVRELLQGGNAHLKPEEVLPDFPARLRGVRPQGLPRTAWQLLEHMRIAQWDIVQFSIDANHVSPAWPEGYWPPSDAPPNPAAWKKSVDEFFADLDRMQKLVANPRTDLFARIPHGSGQTILREALLVADHNAYHLGQIVMVRKALRAWK